jgi:dTDP-4-amino-4,6-dideoxygalactose transaminase
MGIAGDKKLPVSERLYERGFYIPSAIKISDEQIRETAQKVISIFKG